MKIVVLDGYAANPGDVSWEAMQSLGELTVYDRTAPDEVLERAAEADAVLTNKVVITAAMMAQLPALKYIGVLATGYPDFVYWDTPLIELSGKTMGIVGLGSIGMKVATIARQFGMDVFALTSKNSSDLPQGLQKTTLDGLLAISDVLSLHCPLTDDTYHLIDAKALSKMKPGAILINTGRGPLVDEEAVAKALDSGQLMAYGADVMSVEPPQPSNPLLRCPNAYLTPHIAWATFEARQRLMQIAVDNLQCFIDGQPQNVVG